VPSLADTSDDLPRFCDDADDADDDADVADDADDTDGDAGDADDTDTDTGCWGITLSSNPSSEPLLLDDPCKLKVRANSSISAGGKE
jgi:hypothetical protein